MSTTTKIVMSSQIFCLFYYIHSVVCTIHGFELCEIIRFLSPSVCVTTFSRFLTLLSQFSLRSISFWMAFRFSWAWVASHFFLFYLMYLCMFYVYCLCMILVFCSVSTATVVSLRACSLVEILFLLNPVCGARCYVVCIYYVCKQ